MKLREILEQRRREKEIREKKEAAKKVAIGVTVGTVIGAITGILTAPKSGKETREDIVNKTKETTETVKGTIKDSVQAIKEGEEKLRKDIKGKVEEFKTRDMIKLDMGTVEKSEVENEPDTENSEEM